MTISTQLSFFGFFLAFVFTGECALGQSPTLAKRSETPKVATPTNAPKLAKVPTTERNAAPQASSQKPKSTLLTRSSATTLPDSDSATYQLRYRMKPNQKLVSEVTHLATTHTKINDTEQSSQSRTVSRKVWTVKQVEKNGDMTFVHQVDSVDMSQQIGDEEEQRYNSQTDKDPPSIFSAVADSIGKPIATVTITPSGQVVDRSAEANGANLGMGDITIPMPEESIIVGDQWETSREIRVRRTDGTPMPVKVRELYTLEKVSTGVAVISIRSEPLTPLSEPEVEAQALQQMSNGTIRFDLDAGQLISKHLAWDKSVVGFSGSGSVMDYSARLDEVVR